MMLPTRSKMAKGNISQAQCLYAESDMTSDETELIKRARKGDQLALATVLKRHERGLYSSALVILRSSWDAQDAVQETLYEACANIGSLRDPDRLGAWLSVILTRKCCNQLRSTRPTVGLEDTQSEGHAFIGTERDDELLRAVSALPDEQRVAIVLRFFQDLSYRDIEAATGWPLGTVKSRINRAVRHLRAALTTRSIGHGL